jgi:hypothetical protein
MTVMGSLLLKHNPVMLVMRINGESGVLPIPQ